MDGWHVYAKKVAGKMVSTGVRVGHRNPKKLGLTHFETDDQKQWLTSKLSEKDKGRRHLQANEAMCNSLGSKDSPCKRKGIVVLVRFADHANRVLPPSSSYDVLFNNNGPDPATSPTGSVFDIFRINSYGAYVYENHITDWILVSQTEKYAAAGNMGLGTDQVMETWKEALSNVDAQGFNFADFDEDGTGMVDAVVFIHSGAGAEKGGLDCVTENDFPDRIWSYQHAGLNWSADGVKVDRYYAASGVTHNCPLNEKFEDDKAKPEWNIARIGVIAHECGHFMGLPDLYDTTGAAGVGSYCLMGKCVYTILCVLYFVVC